MSAPAHIARENGKKGGRPPGARSEKTLERDRKAAILRERIVRATDKLLNIQLIVAEGTHRMVTITTDADGRKHVETVKSQTEIDRLLESGKYGEDYLILAGHQPDWKAAEAMLDRAFGTAVQAFDVTTKGQSLFKPTPEVEKLAQEYENRLREGLK